MTARGRGGELVEMELAKSEPTATAIAKSGVDIFEKLRRPVLRVSKTVVPDTPTNDRATNKFDLAGAVNQSCHMSPVFPEWK